MEELQEDRNRQARDALASWRRRMPVDYLLADANFQHVLKMHLGEDYLRHESMLRRAASLSATRMDALARTSNRDENLPRLSRYNGIGERTEQIVFHPDYHELGACVWDTGVLAVLKEPGNEVLCGALAYFIAHNGEAGHACPVACTAGLIKLLQQIGSNEQKQRYLPGLLQTDYAKRLHAAQFVTEVQGGSDVAQNSTVAVPDARRKGLYRITGEKWFCSVMDASLFVVTARPEGAPEGTQGLGLFLVPREIDGKVNEFSIRRLKYKLGTRSMASAEVDFNGALAEPIGPLESGFKNLMGIVIDTSRVHNAVAACGLMRRACLEARTYARHRTAFGSPLIQFPAVAHLLARMDVTACAAVSTTFRILALGDRLAAGAATPDAGLARRTWVNINKYWTSMQCTRVIHDAIEVLGGNGAIEEFSVLPRLYRDAIVLESWEGAHNTLCAQVLRDFAKRGLHRPWLEMMHEMLSEAEGYEALDPHWRLAAHLLDEVESRIGRLLSEKPEYAALHIRGVVDRMCVLSAYLSLLLEYAWESDQGVDSGKGPKAALFLTLHAGLADPMDQPELPRRIQEVCASWD